MLQTDTYPFSALFKPGTVDTTALLDGLMLPSPFLRMLKAHRFCAIQGVEAPEWAIPGFVDEARLLEVRESPPPALLVHRWEPPADPYDAVDSIVDLGPSETLKHLMLSVLAAQADEELRAYLAAAGYRARP